MSDADSIHPNGFIDWRADCPPRATVRHRENGDVQVQLTIGPLSMWVTPDDWRRLNAAVESALVGDQLRADAAECPATIGESPVLAAIADSEGIR